MQTLTLTLPKPHSGQRRARRASRRFNIGACGRRWGKTTFFQELAIAPALTGYPVGWFAPSYKLLLEAWRGIEQMARSITRRSNATDRRIELVTGGVLEFWTLEDRDAGRSRKYKRIIIDEAGLVRDLLAIWHQAIRPTLADLSGDAWVGGTPKGRNDFYTLFNEWSVMPNGMTWRAPTEDNPHIPPDEIAEMRMSLPALVAAQELDAEFTEGELTLFGIADIDQAYRNATGPADHQQGRSYVTTVDVGRRRDATVINTFDVSVVPYQRVAFDRLERIPYPVIQQRIADRYRAYGGQLVIESNGIGDPLIENLDVPAERFVTTARSKVQAIQALQLLFERGEIAAQWDSRERATLVGAAWDDDHTADEVMSLAIFAATVSNPSANRIMEFYRQRAISGAATTER